MLKNTIRTIACLTLIIVVTGHDVLIAEGPEQELLTGRYEMTTVELSAYLDGIVRINVADISPSLNENSVGISDQLFFECSADQGLVSRGGYSHFSNYIRSAFIGQLKIVDLYSPDAMLVLSGELLNVELYYDRMFGEVGSSGNWSLSMKLHSSLGGEEIFTVEHSYPIRNQENYCQEMVDQFMTSVQLLMVEIIGGNKFINLIQPS